MVKKLIFILVLLLGAYVARESYFYFLIRESLPVGTTIADVDVGKLTLVEAGEKVVAAYNRPIIITSETADERADIPPTQIGFELKLEAMLEEAEEKHLAQEWWVGFLGYLIRNPVQPIVVDIQADHSVDRIYELADEAVALMGDPAVPPRVAPGTRQFLPGKDGYTIDADSAAQDILNALYDVEDRDVELKTIPQEAPPPDMTMLQQFLVDTTSPFQAFVGSIFVKNLQTAEEISINGDLALSGMSIIKIAILLETYRVIDNTPDFDQQKLINETAINSGNYSANLLLDVVAGQDNAYLGSDILTESMNRLGLQNTFIVTPYEEPSRPERSTKLTPANSVPNLLTDPDPSMQTTAEDMGTLLAMIYECANDGGALRALYPDTLTPEECQAIIDVLALNTEGNLIRYGVPDGTVVSHKHGWATNTHGDGGIVYTEGGDYVIVTYITEPGTSWLVADYSFPILRDTSQIVYNYFNIENPYLEDILAKAIAIQDAIWAEEAAAEAAAEAGGNGESFDLDANGEQTAPDN